MGDKHSDLVDEMKLSLKEARRVSGTMDCWSGKNSVDNYLGKLIGKSSHSPSQNYKTRTTKQLEMLGLNFLETLEN